VPYSCLDLLNNKNRGVKDQSKYPDTLKAMVFKTGAGIGYLLPHQFPQDKSNRTNMRG
jgi:hypothetical protein